MGRVERLLLIQSMVVVTSPMGVQTPPQLAAMTTSAPKMPRSSLSGMSLRRSDTCSQDQGAVVKPRWWTMDRT